MSETKNAKKFHLLELSMKCLTILVYLGVISKFWRCGIKLDPSLVLPFWWMPCLNRSLTFMMQLFIFSLLSLFPPSQIFILVSTTLLASFSTFFLSQWLCSTLWLSKYFYFKFQYVCFQIIASIHVQGVHVKVHVQDILALKVWASTQAKALLIK